MDNASIIRLRQTQQELNDYLTFYNTLAITHSDADVVGNMARKAIKLVQSSNRYIGRLIGSGGTSVTQREIEQIYRNVDELNIINERLDALMKKNADIRKSVEKISKQTKLSPDKFNLTSDLMRDIVNATNVQKTKTDLNTGTLNKIASFDVDRMMMGGITPTILGPYASLLISGVKAFKSPISIGLMKLLGKTFKRGFSSKIDLNQGLLGKGSSTPTSGGAVPAGYDAPMMSNDKASVEKATNPLALFFDKIAFKSKWTKDVYKFLKGGKDSESAGGGLLSGIKDLFDGPILNNFVNGIGTAFGSAIKLLGISGLAVGAFVGYSLWADAISPLLESRERVTKQIDKNLETLQQQLKDGVITKKEFDEQSQQFLQNRKDAENNYLTALNLVFDNFSNTTWKQYWNEEFIPYLRGLFPKTTKLIEKPIVQDWFDTVSKMDKVSDWVLPAYYYDMYKLASQFYVSKMGRTGNLGTTGNPIDGFKEFRNELVRPSGRDLVLGPEYNTPNKSNAQASDLLSVFTQHQTKIAEKQLEAIEKQTNSLDKFKEALEKDLSKQRTQNAPVYQNTKKETSFIDFLNNRYNNGYFTLGIP